MGNAMRLEYPRPQMARETWENLNGIWDFEFDFSKSGVERKFYATGNFTKKINVPFCPESKLSGIGFTDFIPAVWYRRTVSISKEQLENKVLLHFGAVDYECKLYINEKLVGTHKGGYASFSFDITTFLNIGDNTIVLYAEDDLRSGKQPRGKQASGFYSSGCDYTRTTGIWQTVWLEFVPQIYIKKYRVRPDAENSAANISISLSEAATGMTVFLAAFFEGKKVGDCTSIASGDLASMRLALSEKHLWDVGQPNLYDLEITLSKGNAPVDTVKGYFGLRTISIKDKTIHLNGRPVFQRLVLDQGFYPDGIYTAPTDEDLKKDIELSMSIGFNGARLHEKVFEERFLYHADKLGYLVWGEHGNWGLDISVADGLIGFLPEWIEVIDRDFNHPSIIGWCPFNETWDQPHGKHQIDAILSTVYQVTKAMDPTRPVIDTSGNFHVITDIYDIHDYEQDTNIYKERYSSLKRGEVFDDYKDRQTYGGQPYFVSEYGGAWWNPETVKTADKGEDSWGYGTTPTSEEEVCHRYVELTTTLLRSDAVCAFCYTQLYDIEQEQNGLFTYDRNEKFSKEIYEKIRKANLTTAKIEEK